MPDAINGPIIGIANTAMLLHLLSFFHVSNPNASIKATIDTIASKIRLTIGPINGILTPCYLAFFYQYIKFIVGISFRPRAQNRELRTS